MNGFNEYKKLKRTVRAVLGKVRHDRDTLALFQQYELALLSCSRLSDLINTLTRELPRHFALDAVELLLFDPEHAIEELLAGQQPANLSLTSLYKPLKQLYPADPQPRMLVRPQSRPLPVLQNRPEIQSSALLPLVRHGVVCGSLHLGSRDPSRFGTQVATDYICHLASVAAVCLENCINQEALRRMSFIDMLTQVQNRRAFDRELPRELSRATRNLQPLSCLFLDLDHFKQINDTYGHQTGDRALHTVAQAIRLKLRQTDTLARYGGEEFAALLPGCCAEQAVSVAEGIRQAISELQLSSDDGRRFRATLSVGVSTCPTQFQGQMDFDRLARLLVDCADKGVYTAKRSGRNQVVYQPFPSLAPSRVKAAG